MVINSAFPSKHGPNSLLNAFYSLQAHIKTTTYVPYINYLYSGIHVQTLFAIEMKNVNYLNGKSNFGCETIHFIIGCWVLQTQVKEISQLGNLSTI